MNRTWQKPDSGGLGPSRGLEAPCVPAVQSIAGCRGHEARADGAASGIRILFAFLFSAGDNVALALNARLFVSSPHLILTLRWPVPLAPTGDRRCR